MIQSYIDKVNYLIMYIGLLKLVGHKDLAKLHCSSSSIYLLHGTPFFLHDAHHVHHCEYLGILVGHPVEAHVHRDESLGVRHASHLFHVRIYLDDLYIC